MRTDDIRLHPFAHNFNVFLHCSNPRQVYNTDFLLEHTTISTVLTPLILYHSPVRISLSIVYIHHASVPSSPPSIVVPPDDITWLSFDSVIYSFG